MQSGQNDPPTWKRLPVDRTKLNVRYHDLDVFELNPAGETSAAQPNTPHGPRSDQLQEPANVEESDQRNLEQLPLITKLFMQRSIPWLNIPPSLTALPAWVDQIIGIFFSHHVLTTDVYNTSLPGYMEELPSMFHAAPIDSALVEAVKAASLMGALNRNEVERGSDFHDTALRSYSQALRKLRSDLQEPTTATSDETLMTIIMLDQMETYSYPDRPLPLGPHLTGLIYVMQLRGSAQLFSQRGWSLFRVAHHRLVS